jgi:hypothetical protein
MRFVDEAHAASEPVVTVGPASDVYRDYYQRDWRSLTSLAELRDVRAGREPVWVIYTLEGYIESQAPDLMQTLRTECAPARVFRGTLGNGNITACLLPPPVRPGP